MNSIRVCLKLAVGTVIAVSLASCVAAEKLYVNLKPSIVHTNHFDLQSGQRITHSQVSANIYIEGDGLAWLDINQPSRNPTPSDPIALRLAEQDQATNVVYLARPCQFIDPPKRNCTPDYWTGKRFAPAVIASYDEALSQLKAEHGLTGFNLIGYSGGGVIAALLAAKRSDISSLRTVGSPMDIDRFTQIHAVSPLIGSLNPANYATQLDAMPQRHFTGGRDTIVPAAVLTSYMDKFINRRCIAVTAIAINDHESWVEQWPQLLQLPVMCKN